MLRRILPFLTLALVAGALYDSWIFYSRSQATREAERARAEKEARSARQTIDQLGGGGLKILNFYASPAIIKRGEKSRLCYSVFGAKAVRLEPPVQELHPALSYCFDVSPLKSTEYKLLADDGAGSTAQQSLMVKVTP